MRAVSHWLLVGLAVLVVQTAAFANTTLTVAAPPSLAGAADQLRSMNVPQLEADLGRAGLAMPPALDITLVPESDPEASGVPRWIVGYAVPPRDIVIFPERVLAYPYDSLNSVLRHEVVHLALASRADGRPLPRWFHEGVAVSVDAGWGISGRFRLLLETLRNPGTAELARLFASNSQPETALAYGLSAALIADLERRYRADVPSAIAARVAAGAPFTGAFEAETGETPDAAAARAWAAYRRWELWMPIVTSDTSVWSLILALAFAAFIVRTRRRAQRRRRWDEEDLQEHHSETLH